MSLRHMPLAEADLSLNDFDLTGTIDVAPGTFTQRTGIRFSKTADRTKLVVVALSNGRTILLSQSAANELSGEIQVWLPKPASQYGSTESLVSELTQALNVRRHDFQVTFKPVTVPLPIEKLEEMRQIAFRLLQSERSSRTPPQEHDVRAFMHDAQEFFANLQPGQSKVLTLIPASRNGLQQLAMTAGGLLCRRGHMSPDAIYDFARTLRQHGSVHGTFLDALSQAKAGTGVIAKVRSIFDSPAGMR